MKTKKALLMIDLQNDFCAGGSLAVPGGDAVIPVANRLQHLFDCVIATQDWHPQDHMSFASNHHPDYGVGDVITVNQLAQVLWPDHCVQGTNGARLHPELDLTHVTKVIHKGTNKEIDSYSAFFDNAHKQHTGLADYLRAEQVTDLYIIGLATDYCVKYSALDARQLGFNVYVIEDACRGLELNPGDVAAAVAEMLAAGVVIRRSDELIQNCRVD